jgi:hypothetical protein
MHGAAIYSAMPLSSEIPQKDNSLNVNHNEGNQIEKNHYNLTKVSLMI